MYVGPLCVFLEKNAHSHPLFLKLGCFLAIELHEFFIYYGINPLSDISFANIFYQSIG